MALAASAQAQVSYTGGVYSQNFDSLLGTTNNTLNSTWTDNVTLPGWYSNKTTFSVTDGTVGGTAATFDSTSATVNNVGMFSFGTASSTDRALGARATSNFAGNDPVLYGVRLVNNTSQTLTKFTVTYTGEQWFKSSVATAHTLLLDYQLGATAISTGTWPAATSATFTAPIATGTTATALNGNTTANRTARVAVVTGLSWAPGQELWIRFRDANESGNEQGLAVDDFSFLADDESGLFFNGSSSYVTMGFGATAASLNASNFTVECRFMRTGPGVTASTGTGGITTALPLVAKGVGEADGTNVDANYFLGIDNVTGKLVADFEQLNATNDGTARAAGLNFPIIGSTVLQNGVWYHAAATYNTTTATWALYLNGVAEAAVVPSGAAAAFVGVVPRNDNIQGLGIGTTINSLGARAGFFQGLIDEVRIWNAARPAADILANKDVKIASGTPGLLGRYGFDEATGTTAAGINAAGTAAPVGTLSGTVLPTWVNAKSFTVNLAPTVALTSPSGGATFTAPTSVNLAATATDSDGTIAKVEFFNGATKLGEDLTAPYTFSWTRSNSETGTFSVTAVASDNGGSTTTSSAVSFTVAPNPNQPTIVTPSAPANNATGIGSSTDLNLTLSDPENDAMTVTYYGRRTAPVTPGADFTIATLPDTQFYSENLGNNGRFATYYAQTQWLVDNRNSLNLAFVSHMGDIVQNGDAIPAEWVVADTAMKKIEDPISTLRAYGIPWGAAPGNHDQTGLAGAGGVNSYYNQYFPAARYAGRNYWGGSQSPANNHNNYQLFSASGLDFIIIHMEYDIRSKASYQTVLDWADALMKANPDRRAIVTSHWIVNTGNPATFSTQGQDIYNDLKDNPNFFMMLCGHVAGEGQRTDTFQGRAVHSVLQDYQGRVNGGDGWLRYFVFSPTNNTISAKTYRVSNPVNPAAGAFETDADSQFTLAYNMQTSVTEWIPLGTVNVAAGVTTSSLPWTGLEAGKDYEWYATVNDSVNTATSSTRRFSTTPAAAPQIALTAPVDGASFPINSTINLGATATDSDGTISKVEFFDGATKLSEDTSAPYEFSLVSPTPGNHILSAVATDNSNLSTLSSLVTISITNTAPLVALTDPDEADSFGDAPASTHFEAIASDPDGSISKVQFFANAIMVGEVTIPAADGVTYIYNWNTGYTGTYLLTAKAFDNFGAVTTSTEVRTLHVVNVDNVAPTVAITSPTNNGVFATGSTITINATAADTDGTVSKVEFYQGSTKIGEDTTAPYSYAWSGVAAGTYVLTAVATDNDGGTATSGSTTIAVAAGPARPFFGTLVENFDSMGTGSSFILGWSIRNGASGTTNSTWTDATGILGSGLTAMVATTGTLTYNNLPAGPAATNVNGYNLRGDSDSDRAIGTSPTGVAGVAIQAQLTNNGTSGITGLQIGYDIRRYVAVASANELPGYWLFYSLDGGTTWTNVSAINPTIASVPNTLGTSSVPLTAVTLSSIWSPGTDLLLRWVDDNAVATSPDHIHALDNVTIQGISVIGAAPVVQLTSPANNSSSNAPAAFSLAATATDADGTISKVEFYAGATKLGEDTIAPYTYDWSNVTAGTYSLTARATDNDGNLVISAPISVTSVPPPSSGTLSRGPYLNQANHNSIVVRWRSTQSIAGRVRYGTSSTNLNQVLDETTSKTDHEVKLTGLSSYTRYFYSVGSAYDTLTPEVAETTSFTPGAPAPTAADYTFRTSPVPGTAVNTRIWIVGDCGRGTQVQATGRDAYYSYNGSSSYTGSRIPDLNLQMGDNAYNSGTDSEYQSGYFNMYSNIFRKMPQWSCLGNHDANNGSTSTTANFPYFDMFTFPTAGECGGVASGTERYYSFDYGNIHFICLDSQASNTAVDNPATAGTNEDGPMATWLRADLAANTATWTVAFWHHPPYSKGSHDSDTEAQMVNMRTNFNPILENGGVDLLYFGHSHNYERSVLLDGHYGTTGTITTAMKKNAGNGSIGGFTTTASGTIRNATNGFTATSTVNGAVIPGDGAYIKPLTGPRDRFGAVYNTAGMSGQADGGTLNHSAMYICYNSVGTVNLDVNGNTLTSTFVQSGGATPDNFTITKQGAADTDGDGISDAYEIANGLNRYVNDAASSADSDGLSNLLEFAFGLNPKVNDAGPVEADVRGALLTKRGTPIPWYQTTTNGTDFRVIFIRRKDAVEAGLNYTPQFSGDMINWETSLVTPTVIADGGEVEAVSIKYPFFAAGKKARFFRVGVSSNH